MNARRQPALRHLQLSDHTGNLTCTRCNGSSWCEHIEKAILGGYDVPTFWHSGQSNYFRVRVPMIPTQNQYATATVEREDDTRPYRLYLIRPDKPENQMGIDLGITGDGEGIKIWRAMIYDYFTAHVTENQKCGNRSHSFQAQNKLAADLRQKPTEAAPRAQVWSMWFNKMCLSCHEAKTVLFDTDEFVPDDPGARRSWSGTYGGR